MTKRKTHKDRLIENIKALEVAYSQMIDILSAGISLTEISDDKWKHIADGKLKAQETADKLLNELKTKEAELNNIENPKEEVVEEKTMSKYLK